MPSLKNKSPTSSKSQLNKFKSSFLLQLDFRWNLKAGRRLTRDRVVFCVSAGENQELKRLQDQTRKSGEGGVLQELKTFLCTVTCRKARRGGELKRLDGQRQTWTKFREKRDLVGLRRFHAITLSHTQDSFQVFRESHSLIWLKTARKAK